MPYLRTNIATDWPEQEPQGSLIERLFTSLLLKFIPESNPDYKGKMHLVHEWFIEFDEEGLPWREIGVDKDGQVVLAGPDDSNYGFWLDTNMRLEDFTGESVEPDEFERMWKESGVIEPS